VTSQPGWHPDPVPPQPGQPAQLRYWDGTRWTEHTAPAQGPAGSVAPGGGPAAYAGTYAGTPAGTPALASTYAAAYAGAATTPDGAPLAGWWHRVGALLIDWVVVTALVAVLTIPWLRDLWHSYRDVLDQLVDDSRNGTSTVDTGQLQRDVAGPAAVIALVTLAVTFCYHVGFLMWRQATPGKLAVGLRVRLRERPGPLPLGTVLLRWLAQFGVRLLNLVPAVGVLVGLYLLLDYLWPLWDEKNQALHDKVAATNVVRVR
jgi:uncharacterized RDD family membrane protein YckC